MVHRTLLARGLDEYVEDMAEVLASAGPRDFKGITVIAAKHEIESNFSTIAMLHDKYGVRRIGM